MKSTPAIASILGCHLLALLMPNPGFAQMTVPRIWNEQLLHSISIDTARPTVHARNLFHLSAAMYDAWTAYDPIAAPYLHAERATAPDITAARREAISYAAYQVIMHRFVTGPAGIGPGRNESRILLRQQMQDLGYDPDFTATVGNTPAAVGNRVAQTIIQQALVDGANEVNNYSYGNSYVPVNPPLTFDLPGTTMVDPNRWQPLHFLGNRIDQFGQPINEATQRNLTPFWGAVRPFAMTSSDRSPRGVYHDQGMPPLLGQAGDAQFKANALMVIRCSSQLDPRDGVMMDISPASRGNSPLGTYQQFGYSVNPATGQPYTPQLVKQGDFARVVSEFWADGPHSTAPPGHWNEIANEVTDRMDSLGIPKRIGGTGPVVDGMEWDVKKYFAINGALHDAAIAAWNHKGSYDTSRPISFIRYMGQRGQSSDPNHTVQLPNGNVVSTYDPLGLPLEAGLVEVVTAETTATGGRHAHLAGSEGKIAIRSWQGAIEGIYPFTNPDQISGVGWILAEEWMPYQLSSFVTPPFAGYVSGHSTFSRAAAEVLTEFTGDPFFPGGMGTYSIDAGIGLFFEHGPSAPLQLQWATYFDASDQASLSRLYGGIHPAGDDLPGRQIGHAVGLASWNLASNYFAGVPEPGSGFALIFLACLVLRFRRGWRVAACVALLWATPSATWAVTFTSVTSAMGLAHVQSSTPGVEAMTGGAVAGDFDGDGRVDLFFTRVDGPDVMYRNTGSGFVDVSATAGFTQALPSAGAAASDIDNDGDLDIYVSASSHARHYLYVNDGQGRFTEDALARGAAVPATAPLTRRGMGVAFGDYDRDGYVDLLTSDHSRPAATSGSRLLRNLGAANPGHFEDVTEAVGLHAYRPPIYVPGSTFRFTPQFSDLDKDGLLDIVFASDAYTSQLFWNNGNGTFTDGTIPARVGTDKSGMGSAIGDYDADGDLDWFVTAIFDTPFLGAQPGNRLYRNDGSRVFTDVTTAAGVRNTGPGLSWGWGTSFLDYDNDGDSDLAATNGFVALGYGADRTTIWRNNGNGTFADVSATSGVTDTAQGRGLLRLDYDSDGDLDMLVVNYAGPPILYRNDGGNELGWLRVQTEGTASNRDGISTQIQVVADDSVTGPTLLQEIGAGSSYLSQDERAAHFGLGDHTGTVDRVIVTWPATGLVQHYVHVAGNGTLIARERLLGDFNADGIVDDADRLVWESSLGMTGTGLAADGAGPHGIPDGVVDMLDYAYWSANFGLTYNGQVLGIPEPTGWLLLVVSWGLHLARAGRGT